MRCCFLLFFMMVIVAAGAQSTQPAGDDVGRGALPGKLQPGEVSIVNVAAKSCGLNNFKIQSEMRNSRLWLRGFTANLGTGKVRASGSVDWSNPEGPHSLDINFSEVEIVKALRVFDIVLHANVIGKLSGDLKVQWSGLRSREVRKSVNGKAQFKLGAGSVSNLAILNEVARMTGIQELTSFDFSSGEASADIRSGTMFIQLPGAAGKTEHITAKGTLNLPGQSIDVAGQMSLSPELAGKSGYPAVRAAAGLFGAFENRNKPRQFVSLPFLIRMAGNVEAPDFSIEALAQTKKENK